MIFFWLLAALFVVAIMFQVLRPLWFGQKAAADDQIPLAIYRERLQRLERDVEAGRLDPKEADAVREQLGRELLEQVEDADPPAETARHRAMALIVSATVAALAIGIYLTLGNPAAVTHTEHVTPDEVTLAAPADGDAAPAPSLQDAVASLEARLQQNPESVEDWLLLGRSYAAMERWNDAVEAIRKASELAPERTDVLVDYAEALARLQGAQLQGEPRQILERVMEMDPGNAKGAWLLGMAFYQAQEFSQAVDLWEAVLEGIPADNPAAAALTKQIADARELAGQAGPGDTQEPAATPSPSAMPATGPSTGSSGTPAAPATSTGPSITVQVDLAPDLAGQVSGMETLFVFARAANGPPIPLAVQRLGTRSFPVTVTLDESMAMMPNMALSNFPQVVVGARISPSGNVQSQPGDLETLSDPIASDTDQPVVLVIDQIVE